MQESSKEKNSIEWAYARSHKGFRSQPDGYIKLNAQLATGHWD